MKYLVLLVASLVLSACGGGSSSGGPGTIVQKPVERNVALSSGGASVSTSYDEGSAEYAIDGDASESLYWSGNITDDFLMIDFGSVVEISDLT